VVVGKYTVYNDFNVLFFLRYEKKNVCNATHKKRVKETSKRNVSSLNVLFEVASIFSSYFVHNDRKKKMYTSA
jgi:hypothetical protein